MSSRPSRESRPLEDSRTSSQGSVSVSDMGAGAPVPIEEWAGAYDDGWRDIIVPAAFAHPAKMSRGLVQRIFDELIESGALKPGDTCVDPFGGIGTTGIEGACSGIRVVCVELEPKFCELAGLNFAKHRPDWQDMGLPQPVIVQGDSRYLRLVLKAADALVSSPPYASGGHHPDQTGAWNTNGRGQGGTRAAAGYGTEDGQLGQMPAGDVDAVIASPPYAEIASGAGGLNTKAPQHPGQDAGRSPNSPSQRADQRYGDAEGQLARLPAGGVDAVVASPPYATETFNERVGIDLTKFREGQRPAGWNSQARKTGTYGEASENLANMPEGAVDAVVASPPFLDARSETTASVKGHTPTLHDPEAMGTANGNLSRMAAGDVDAIVSSPPFTQGYAGGGGINRVGYRKDGVTDDKVGERTYQGTAAAREPGNLETLQLGEVAAVVSSPPYEGSLHESEDGIDWQKAKNGNDGGGQTKGQSAAASVVGSSRDTETFWTAAHQVVRESFAILKPGGVAVWVVKAFVRDKKLVDFPGDWRKLCEHVGFETIRECHASLVAEETVTDLFGPDRVKRRERKSFFRRLAEKKGSPRIDFECVYFMRRPGGAR